MKNKLIFFLILTAGFISCKSVTKDVIIKDRQALKKQVRIAVLPFQDAPGKKGSGSIISESITNEMLRINNWNVVERSKLNSIIKQQKLDASGLIDSDYDSLGKLTRADYIVLGNVNEYSYEKKFLIVPRTRLSFNMRIINVKTGDIAASADYNLETGKYAFCGCLFFGIYYMGYSLMTDDNINIYVNEGSWAVVHKIKGKLKK